LGGQLRASLLGQDRLLGKNQKRFGAHGLLWASCLRLVLFA
jgi:hypothetical protein